MKTSDAQLRDRFAAALDEVLPPAPWLEDRVVDALSMRHRPRRRPLGLDTTVGFGRGLRLAAGLVAILIGIATVATLLISARIHLTSVPAGPKTRVQTPSPTPSFTFTPSPAVRSVTWPPGGPVPAPLAGCWQPAFDSETLCLGGYTFEFVVGAVDGNVVVNGDEIDFISDICTQAGTFGFDRYHYTISGTTLTLIRLRDSTSSSSPGSGGLGTQIGNCGWKLEGRWTKLAGG
jgi:hypothetical protein